MKGRPKLALIVAGSLPVLTACVDVAQEEAEAREEMVTGSGERAYWDTELLVRIASLAGATDALTQVGQVLIRPDTSVIVSQPRSASILVYDHEGVLVRRIGRRGQGPGEFEAIGGVGLIGDTLYVSDPALDRVTHFTVSGELLGSRRWFSEPFQLSDHERFTSTPPQVVRADGTGIVQPSMVITPRMSARPGVNTMVRRTPYLHMDGSAAVLDTLVWWEVETVSLGMARGGRTLFFIARPFLDYPLLRMIPDGTGVVLVERAERIVGADAFRVIRIEVGGDTAFAQSFAYRSVSLPDSFVNQTFEELVAFYEGVDAIPSAGEVRRAFQDFGLIPEHSVPVTHLAVGQDGSIWLRREDIGAPWVTWDVLDANEGSIVGSVRLPATDTVFAAYGDLIAAVAPGNFDVPYIHLYRLSAG